MKKTALIVSVMVLSSIAFAASGDTYGPCYSPNDDYKCYNIDETPVCPNGLKYVSKWCPGGNNIKCCAPQGTKDREPASAQTLSAQLPDTAEYTTHDFLLYLEGTLSCSYTVKSNGVVTKESSYPCDSYVLIKVGPNGDCRNEGREACVIINDGGYLGSQKTLTKSIKFDKSMRSYGSCVSEYSDFSCMQESSCSKSGGAPVRGFCPQIKSSRIKCCVYTAGDVTDAAKSFIFDKSSAKTFSDISAVNNELLSMKEKRGVKVIIEIVDNLPPDAKKDLVDKFVVKYKLGESSQTGMEMVILYAKKKDAWRYVGMKNCKIDEALMRKIIEDASISGKLKEKKYDEAFANFVNLLEASIARKSSSGKNVCAADAKPDCGGTCGGLLAPAYRLFSDCKTECEGKRDCVWTDSECKDVSSYSPETCFDIGTNEALCKNTKFTGSNGLSCMWDYKECVPRFRVEKILIDYGRAKAVACGHDAAGRVTTLENVLTYAKRTPDEKGILRASLPRGTVMKIQRWVGGYDANGNFRNGATSPLYTNTMVPWGKEDKIKNPSDGKLHEKYTNAYGAAYAHLVTAKAQNIEGMGFVPAGVSTGKQLHGTEGPVLDDFFDDTYNRYCSILKPLRNFRLVYGFGTDVKDLWQYVVDEKLDIYTTDSSNTASHGCLRTTNRFILWLEKNAPVSTPVFYIDSSEGDSPKCEDYVEKVSPGSVAVTESSMVLQLEDVIKEKYGRSDAREWAAAIVNAAKYKKPEYISLIASFVRQESKFDANPFNLKEAAAKTQYWFQDLFGMDTGGPTLGCMQIRLCKAAMLTGVPPQNMVSIYDSMLTMNGCLLYGNKYVEELAGIYAPNGVFTDSALMYIAGDYAAGAYSSRNAALQRQLNDLMGTNLVLDGDMLSYEDSCPPKPEDKPSNTELVVRDFLSSRNVRLTNIQIGDELKKEKMNAFEQTTLFKEIKKAWKERFRKEPDYAIVPEAKKRKDGQTSKTYAMATKNSYNFYCTRISCKNPVQITADVEALHRGTSA